MEKNTVTRTFSIGGICSRTRGVEDVCTARRHSSAGIRALLWATSSAKSCGCSLGSDSQTSRENIYLNILTPDSIPQFTIPSLSVQNGFRSLDKESQEDFSESEGLSCSVTDLDSLCASPACSSSSSSSGLFSVLSDRRAERSISDPSSRRRSLLQREVSYPCSHSEAQHCLDPASRAALSLPHLAKVTTPYGFITLSQSPQMASEEALLCQAGLRRFHKDEENAGRVSKAPGTTAVDTHSSSLHLSGDKQEPKDSAGTLIAGTFRGERKASSPQTANNSRKPKQLFYELIRKHFTARGMKS